MNINFLPNAGSARVDREKILQYLLCESHPDGRTKAVFFRKLGFAAEKWEIMAEMLKKHGMKNHVVKTARTGYGVRYCVDGPLDTPTGDKPSVRTVWIVEEGSSEPRLITAYPL